MLKFVDAMADTNPQYSRAFNPCFFSSMIMMMMISKYLDMS